jgi:CheY-like chemotaxis protein
MISKLLCVDDDEITLTLIKIVAERASFAKEIITCRNGAEALAYYQKQIEEKSSDVPELIFLDLNMPVMNGWDFLEEFSKNYYNQFNQTRIVILSSSINTKAIAAKYPIIDYITKPVTADALRRLTNELMQLQETNVH